MERIKRFLSCHLESIKFSYRRFSLNSKKKNQKDSSSIPIKNEKFQLITQSNYNKLSKDPCVNEPCAINPEWKQPKILIVGAGMAGLSAAHRLMACGLSDVVIIEAMNRPGGRINSCKMQGVHVELGALWLEGLTLTNPILNLAYQEGLLEQTLFETNPFRGVYFSKEGYAIETHISIKACNIFENIKKEADYLANSLKENKENITLFNFIKNKIEKSLIEFPDYERYKASCVMYSLLNDIKVRWGADLNEILANNYGCYKNVSSGFTIISGGFNRIISTLIDSLKNCVKFNKVMNFIKYDTSGYSPRVEVKCCDGEVFFADYVIVTIPLGVLKTQSQLMFCPGLSFEKHDAIDKIGFGNINRIFLEFEKPFWLCQDCVIRPSWSLEELLNKDSWIKGISLFEPNPGGKSSILMATVGGSEATDMETIQDCYIVDDIMKLIRKLLNDTTIATPKNILRSSWTSNCYFYGASSFMGLNTDLGHQKILSNAVTGETEIPIIMFAGEATCPNYFGSVHGARLSGIREAERILQWTRMFRGPPPSIPK